MKKRCLAMILVLAILFCVLPPAASAETAETAAKRTIMMYVCGSNLETDAGLATYNLEQILKANFSSDDDVRFVVMTGGSYEWFLDSDFLYDPNTGTSPETISSEYNQIWEACGLDAKTPAYRGKLVLVDGDGLSGDGEAAKPSEEELMNDPETLKAFIDYSVENYPADQYDLILWDHGGGPDGAFAVDQHDGVGKYMSFAELIDALADNAVTRDGGKFDIINFDACLMNSLELELALADYMDYYIASPAVVPGYGEVYTHWLDELGKSPEMNGYALGKMIVDDFIKFYDAGYEDGGRQEGTLAVVDMGKLMDSDFIAALRDMLALMETQLKTDLSFYDELRSASSAWNYEDHGYYDLGNFVAYLGAALKEGDGTKDANEYAGITARLQRIFNNEQIIYAGGTENIRTEDEMWLDENGNGKGGSLGTSGMYMFFPCVRYPNYTIEYYRDMNKAWAEMPENDCVEVLSEWVQMASDYAMLLMAGKAVSTLVDEGVAKEEIDYDTVKEYWLRDIGWGPEFSQWYLDNGIQNLIDQCGGEEAAKVWLDPLIRQQAAEAVYRENIEVYSIDDPKGTGYQVRISNTAQRVIDGVSVNIMAEVPEVEKYLNAEEGSEYYSPYFESLKFMIQMGTVSDDFTIGSISGTREISSEDFEDFGAWLRSTESTWELEPAEGKWFAVRDAEGRNHAAFIERAGVLLGVPAILADQDGKPIMVVETDEYEYDGEQVVRYYYDPELVYLVFNQDGEMTELYSETHERSIRPSDLKEELTFLPAAQCTMGGMFPYFVPMSGPLTITAENAADIRLVYTDLDDIPDIRDGDGDGEKLVRQLVVRDIYGMETALIADPAGELTSIAYAEIGDTVYTGKSQYPVVTLKGKTLTEGTDYLLHAATDDGFVNAGAYVVGLEGIGDYAGFAYVTFTVKPVPEDVPEDSYFKDAVFWAMDKHITLGTSNTTFSPENACTRAQMVTFLWRSAGSPFPESFDCPFNDVDEDAFYYEAVLWAVEQGVTKGTGSTTFSPDLPVTRAQAVTFLWRMEGCAQTAADNPFTDVAEDLFYTDAVLWAVDHQVTTGVTETLFAPEQPCTRAQVVTFLYRLESA